MMMGKMCGVHKVAAVLLTIGGLNWGLVGLFKFDLVARLFGQWEWVARIIYILVGISAIVMLGTGKCCVKDGNMPEKKV